MVNYKKISKLGSITNLSILIYTLLFLLVLIWGNPIYETNDDIGMCSFAMGLLGKMDYHLVFINSIIGKIVIFLLESLPIINWYTVLQVLIVYVSFCTLLTIATKKCKSKKVALLFATIIISFGIDFCYSLQFTKTAGISIIAGLLLLIDLYESKSKNIIKYMYAGLLCLVGTLYRFEFIFIIGFIFSPLYLIALIKSLKNKEIKKIVTFVSAILFIGILIISCKIYDYRQYTQEEVWNNYVTFNPIRANLMDYGWPDYEENKELYKSIGYSKNDYINYNHWDIADPDKVTIENFRLLSEAKDTSVSFVTLMKNYIKNIIDMIFKYPFSILVLIILLYLVIQRMKANNICIIATTIMFFVLEFILVYRGRYLQRRVDITLFVAFSTIMMYIVRPYDLPKLNAKWKLAARSAIILSLIIALANNFYTIMINKPASGKVDKNSEVGDAILQDKDNIYVCNTLMVPNVIKNVWEVYEEGASKNAIGLGGWGTYSGVFFDQFEMNGITNPYKDIIDRDNAYLVTNTYKIKSKYLRENYNEDVKVLCVKNLHGYEIYKITTEELKIDKSKYKDGKNDLIYDSKINKKLELKGHIYEKDTNSFEQKVYIEIKSKTVVNTETTKSSKITKSSKTTNSSKTSKTTKSSKNTKTIINTEYYYSTQIPYAKSDDINNGSYSGFYLDLKRTNYQKGDEVTLYIENENGNYYVKLY